MTIGFVLTRPPGYSETFFKNKIARLIKNGINVILYVDRSDKDFDLCVQKTLPKSNLLHILLFTLKVFILNPIRFCKFITTELASNKSFNEIFKDTYRCLHLLNSTKLDWVHFGFLTSAVGRENIAKVINAKMSVSMRGFDISRYPLKNEGAYNNVWNNIDKVHTISDALFQKAKALGLRPNTAYMKITPAIDINIFNQSVNTNKSDSPVRILTVARLHWSKGLEYTLQALEYLHKTGISFHYTIVGSGNQLERLVFAAHQMGISDKVTFVGKTDQINLLEYYRNSDIYIQYSVQEGFCNATLEAQAMGLPCIVSNVEGLPENVLNNETGWVVPACNSKLLYEKIVDVINLPESERLQIRANAQQRIKKEFTLEIQANKFLDFYNN